MDLQYVSPFLHFVGNHHAYRQICEEFHPDLEAGQCATVYAYFKNHDDYDRVLDFDRTFFGYFDEELQRWPLDALRVLSRVILYVGLLLYLLGIELPKETFLSGLVLVNTLLYLPSLYMPFKRFGPDYTAYIAQAS